ncbi:MAG: YgiT-type zinc finger protein [candidate division Zixibacteria bacterium]|nr:YgiT-type zinc finger protein [candidate division Zixibacteria bacterium]
MRKKYSDCFYCGGVVEEQLLPRELRWQGQLFIFENVPIGVCTQCGEKILLPEVAKAIDRVLQEKRKPTKTIQVPVYHYEPNIA